MNTVKVKCVCCPNKKTIPLTGDQPMCDLCFSPMIVVSASSDLRADRQRAAKQRGGRSAAAVARKKPRDLKSALRDPITITISGAHGSGKSLIASVLWEIFRKTTTVEVPDECLNMEMWGALNVLGSIKPTIVIREIQTTGESRLPFSGAFAGNMDRRGK